MDRRFNINAKFCRFLTTKELPAGVTAVTMPKNRYTDILMKQRNGQYLIRILVVLQMFSYVVARGQVATPTSLNLDQAVALAETNYPTVHVAEAQVEVARENIGLAHTIYMPRLDLLWQENRATVNNIFGSLLPQGIIQSLTGPVLGTKSFTSTFGTTGGVLFSWEPFDFGYRKATVDVARDVTKQTEATMNVTRLDVATSAADAFLA